MIVRVAGSNSTEDMPFLCYICSAFCDGLVTLSEDFYWVCLIVCDLETSIIRRSRYDLGWYVTKRNYFTTRQNYKFLKSWYVKDKFAMSFLFAHSFSSSIPQVCRHSAWQKCPPDGVYCNHRCIVQVRFTFKELGMYLSHLRQPSFCPFSQLNEPIPHGSTLFP